MEDIEIARKYKKEDIRDIAKKVGLVESDLALYGVDKCKILSGLAGCFGRLV